MNKRTQGELRVVITGGGTGGHLFPGLAVAEELKRRLGEVRFLFIGTERGIEARVIPERGERLELLEVTPIKGRSLFDALKSATRVPKAVLDAKRILVEFDADLVIGVGGYASGPTLVAARGLGIPTAILEQNAHVGMSNRIMGRLVGRAYLAFESTKSHFGKSARVLGNPIRESLAELARRAAADPVGFEARAEGVFVFGGSQGARVLNEEVPEALATCFERLGCRVPVVHQCGFEDQDRVIARYKALGFSDEDVTVTPFVDDMSAEYSRAAIVISRAGATTLAELSALGRPSVLVPYPFAADDHQLKNAREFEAAGAAVCIPQSELSTESLSSAVSSLLVDGTTRSRMADAARTLGRPDAALSIVDDICDWLDLDSTIPSGSKAHVEAIEGGSPIRGERGAQNGRTSKTKNAGNKRDASERGDQSAGANAEKLETREHSLRGARQRSYQPYQPQTFSFASQQTQARHRPRKQLVFPA